MAYILDALRRADAERERGAVPSLQSQQNTIVEDDAAPSRPRSLVWAVVALAFAVLALLAWNFLGGSASPARAPVEGAISTPVPAPLPTLQPAPTPPTATVPAVTPGIDAASPTPTTPPAPPVAAAPPTARAAVDARRAPAAPAAPAPKRVGAATTGAPGAAPATAEPRVHSQAELPEDIRRDLPKLVIGGSSYSGDAASRMVMINGQVFHEGDRLAPDLVLERIRLKSAVLAFKGWRYEVLF